VLGLEAAQAAGLEVKRQSGRLGSNHNCQVLVMTVQDDGADNQHIVCLGSTLSPIFADCS
jgi:hypothetical protein